MATDHGQPQDDDRRRSSDAGRDVLGSRSPGSSAAWASTPRSTSTTGEVAECHSTSSIFRGYSVFMKGKDPRDAHFITSRICGICGDNHATCSVLRAEHGLRRASRRRWASGSSTSARRPSTCSTTTSSRTTWSASTSASRWSRRPTPACWEKAEQHRGARTPPMHGYRTIADIMRALNPFTGEFYREALQMSRLTREMFCLMEGRHVHPSTLYPGGVGTVPTVQLFTDYLVRLMKYVEFMKKVVPLHDDLFDFFYEALPGYEEVGRRRILLGCWGVVPGPGRLRLQVPRHDRLGPRRCTSPRASSSTASWSPPTWSTSTWASASCWAARTTRTGQDEEMFVKHDPLGQPGRPAPPVEPDHHPAARRSATSTASTPGSCRRAGSTSAPATTWRSTPAAGRSPGCGPRRSPGWWTSATSRRPGTSVKIHLPKTATQPEVELRVEDPASGRNTIERDRARTYFQAYAAAVALLLRRARRWSEVHAGRHQDLGRRSRCPTRPSAAASTRRCAACSRTTW